MCGDPYPICYFSPIEEKWFIRIRMKSRKREDIGDEPSFTDQGRVVRSESSWEWSSLFDRGWWEGFHFIVVTWGWGREDHITKESRTVIDCNRINQEIKTRETLHPPSRTDKKLRYWITDLVRTLPHPRVYNLLTYLLTNTVVVLGMD